MGLKGDYDGGQIYTASRPIVVKDEVWIYYTGCRRDHSYFATPATARYGMDCRTDVDWSDPRWGDEMTICLAKIKRDRYASLSTGTQGSFIIDHGELDGTRLLVNTRAPLGSVKAQVLDRDHNPIAGFELSACRGFIGDSVAGEITWAGKSLAELPRGSEISLRFVLDDADMFAYELS